jgi:uncharacterized protein
MKPNTAGHRAAAAPEHSAPIPLDAQALATSLDAEGWATVQRVLSTQQCRELAASYDREPLFRSRVIMARHGFGRGEYRYFAYPLPPPVQSLREAFYCPLAAIANRWAEALAERARFPARLEEYLARCHAAGQTRPTPLLLRYGAGDFNCLHQDVYGEQLFPLQITVLLSRPGIDFEGGEFVLTEQRPRMQSRASVVPLEQGDAVIFAVRHRPVRGSRGWYRVMLRHGVSRLRAGARHTLGVIFHDAA